MVGFKRLLIFAVFAATTSLSFLGCGKSPLLNHRMEDPPQPPQQGPKSDEKPKLEFESVGLTAQYEWLAGPQSPDESRLQLKFLDSTAAPVTPDDLEAELWMPDMGHGSAPTSWEAQSVGVININEIYFIMAGFWEVRIKVRRGAHEATRTLRVDL